MSLSQECTKRLEAALDNAGLMVEYPHVTDEWVDVPGEAILGTLLSFGWRVRMEMPERGVYELVTLDSVSPGASGGAHLKLLK